ncbi:serine/threonine protein kinase [Nocardiopsis kunsanensis]|uniref:serine/threonine protein kinase n=1 Tax=Nocardiopsis kunsanensis TaxID=141693 RepID=UPI000348943B|nr:serine/threonine-protein kinase [Nocardiopsis kunsanensis]
MARSPSSEPFDRDRLPPGVEPVADTDPRTLGPYTVVGRIGAGGMGAVYAGIAEDGRRSALKVVHPHFALDPEFLARFGREIDLVSRVDASCTPDFHGADLSAATPWLATEYVPGPTLRGHVREKGALSGGMLMAVAVGLAEALRAIHAAGVVHRDLKPGNVIMSPEGPKVLDFGIARALEGTALTSTGGIIGTPGWMAPEQYEGTEASPSSDMFSWAALVYFAATGREPFGRGAVDVVSHRTRNEPPDPTGLPEEVLGPVRAGLGPDPARRPTAAQALDELTRRWSRTQVGAGAQEPAHEATVVIAVEWSGVEVPEPRKVRRRRRGPVLLPAAASLLLVLALIGSWSLLAPGSDGPDGDAADEEENVPAVESAPEDAVAVAREAVALARGAASFESAYFMSGTEMGDPPWQEFAYTEDPEPVYWQSDLGGPALVEIIEIGEGPDDVVRNSRMRNEGAEDAFYRDPADEAYDTRRELWEDRLVQITEVVDQAREVTYGGVTEVGAAESAVEHETVDERSAGSAGHHYTGSLPSSIEEGESDEHFFHLWVGEDGYPQLLHTHENWTVEGAQGAFENRTNEYVLFEQFGEPVSLALPDEAEIADGPPNTGL